MRSTVALTVVFIVAVVLASSSAVFAAPDDQTVVLDKGYEKVGNVTFDGTTYGVYRYESVVPYASGYEFFADGERVDDAEEARSVARAYAWNRALKEEMDERDLEALRDVGRTSNRAGAVISAPLSAVETALDAVDEAKERERFGMSVWDVAVAAVPQLGGVESALSTVRDELERWNERVDEIGEDVTRVANEAESVRSGGEAEYDELPTLFDDTSDGLQDVEELSDGLANDLSTAAELSGSIAEELEEVERVGGNLASPFRGLSASLEDATSRVEGFSESAGQARGAVEETHERASADEERLTTGWNRRQNAALLVYGTGFAIILVLLGGYAYRRREDIRSLYSAENTRPDE